MGRARVRVSAELMGDALRFPDDARIVGVSGERMAMRGELELTVESPSLPEVAEGETLPEARAGYGLRDGEAVFLGWDAVMASPVVLRPMSKREEKGLAAEPRGG